MNKEYGAWGRKRKSVSLHEKLSTQAEYRSMMEDGGRLRVL